MNHAWLMLLTAASALALDPQNPSPMVEHTREHPRLIESSPDGQRLSLKAGTLFVPARLKTIKETRLMLALHCGGWIPELAAERHQLAVLSVQRSNGYKPLFESKPDTLTDWLEEASALTGRKWSEVVVVGWSNGCSGIRELLRSEPARTQINRVLLIDGIHTSYTDGKPGPLESKIDTTALSDIRDFARGAMNGKKRMLITHGEIFPGTYASTTETADWLLRDLGVQRTTVLRWGPMKTQQLSEAHSGGFDLVGLAGNSAPDHVDQLHALGDWLEVLLKEVPATR